MAFSQLDMEEMEKEFLEDHPSEAVMEELLGDHPSGVAMEARLYQI